VLNRNTLPLKSDNLISESLSFLPFSRKKHEKKKLRLSSDQTYEEVEFLLSPYRHNNVYKEKSSFQSQNTFLSNPHYKTQLSFDEKFLFDIH
jgi:hypothetical protein